MRNAGIVVAALVQLTLGAACFDFGSEAERDAAIDDGGVLDAAIPCVEGPVDTTIGVEARIVGFSLSPTSVVLQSGEVVVWINTDDMEHRLVSGDPGDRIPVEQGGFDTGTLAPGESRAIRFCTPRALPYYCLPHAGQMNGFRLEIQP